MNRTAKVTKYSFQNIIRFKSSRNAYANEVQQQIEVHQMALNESGGVYEVKTKKRRQSYHKELEAISPILHEKVFPVLIVKTDNKGQITKFLNYEDVVYNWSKHKKEILKKLEKNWMTLNTVKGIEELMFNYEEFHDTFTRKPEMKLLFPVLQNADYELDKKYVQSEICNELAANIEIPMSVSYSLSEGENEVPVFRFQGKLDDEKFETKKDGQQKSEARKLLDLVRTLKSSNKVQYRPQIKQTGFFSLDDTTVVTKSLEAISFKIPEFIYQDRITSLTIKN